MRFLGTGAGEGIPNPFCNCRICENARKRKGREIRTRSSFRLNERVLIDMGPDYFSQSVNLDESFVNLKHLLYTHTHDDHYNYTSVWERFAKRSEDNGPLNIYFTEDAFNVIEDFYMISPLTEGREHYISEKNVIFHKLLFEKEYKIDDYLITPLKSEHSTSLEKNTANYLVCGENLCLYYAVDSGMFLDETIEYLKKYRLNVLICECTFPCIDKNFFPKGYGHLDLNLCLENLKNLYNYNIISDETKVYLTHISPIGATHEELCNYAEKLNLPFDFIVAYDSMSI